MELSIQIEGNVCRVALSGELDHHAAGEARTRIDEALREDMAIDALHLNLSGITFMDSAGLGMILGRYRVIAERGGRFVLTGASGYAERILKMAGIYALVEKGE